MPEEPRLETIYVRSLSETAAQKIREAIASGRLEPGARLVEGELAKELGLSRSPVREALYLLEQEGLIIRYPRRGAFVRGLTRRETEEIYSLRSVLEGFALELAIERVTAEDVACLRDMVRRMYEVAASGDAVLFGQLDAEFHEYICKVSGHQVLQHVFSSLHTRTSQYMTEASQLGVLHRIARDHEELIEHIVHGDPQEAVAAMKKHIHVSAERLLRGFPDYPTPEHASDEVK